MIGKYCGGSIPASHVSSSNEVLIQFKSDNSNIQTRTGFKMEYNPTGKQNTSIQYKTEYYDDYYREVWEHYLPGPVIALFLFLNLRVSINISFNNNVYIVK